MQPLGISSVSLLLSVKSDSVDLSRVCHLEGVELCCEESMSAQFGWWLLSFFLCVKLLFLRDCLFDEGLRA